MLNNSGLLMLFTVLLFTLQTLCYKVFNEKYMKNITSYFVFNFLSSLLVSLLFFTLAGRNQTYHAHTVLLGISFGIVYILTVLFYTKGMESGPLSLTTLIYMSSILIPVLTGVIVWGETISAVQIAGLVLMMVMFYIMVNPKQSGEGKINVKWIIYSLLAFVCNGTLGVLLKYHQRLSPQKEIFEFMAAAFAASAVISIPVLLFYMKTKNESLCHLNNIRFFILAAAAAITAGVGNGLNLTLTGIVPGIILFPVVSGSMMILSAVISIIFFKEAITKRGYMGFGIGLLSVVLLSLK